MNCETQNIMRDAAQEAGFSYIDVVIALLILMVGILAMLSAITVSVVQSRGQEEQLRAKQIAVSTLESIMSLKERRDGNVSWNRIQNCTAVCTAAQPQNGFFPTGLRPVQPDAGLDRIIGTADDAGAALPGFARQIVIQDICDPDRPSANCNPPGTNPVMVRRVTVTINYQVNNLVRQETIATVLTNYRDN